jgi:hypothetical protein
MMSLPLVAAVTVMVTACFGGVLTSVATLSVTEMFVPAVATGHLGFVLAVPSSIIVTCGRFS